MGIVHSLTRTSNAHLHIETTIALSLTLSLALFLSHTHALSLSHITKDTHQRCSHNQETMVVNTYSKVDQKLVALRKPYTPANKPMVYMKLQS
jgi:hypothetical protein